MAVVPGQVTIKLLSGVEAALAFKGGMTTMAFIVAAAAALEKEPKKLRVYRGGEEIQASSGARNMCHGYLTLQALFRCSTQMRLS
jgi:hypothetical protein